MAKKKTQVLQAYRDAKKDSADEYPRLVPSNHASKRKYNGHSVDWFIARSLRELDKYDRELRNDPTNSPKPPVHDPLDPLYDQIGLKRNRAGKVLEEITFDQVLPLLPDEQMICVGSGNGYFFMGRVAEFRRIVSTIERMYALRAAFVRPSVYNRFNPETSFTQRRIKEVFTRDFPGEPVMMAFSLDGEEFSPFSLYSEYQHGKKKNWPFVWPVLPGICDA